MRENYEEKSNYVSDYPEITSSSNDKIWKGFSLKSLRFPESGFIDAARLTLDIEQIYGPMKFRAAGAKHFLNSPTYLRLHRPDDLIHGHWQGSQSAIKLSIESEYIEKITQNRFQFEVLNNIQEQSPIISYFLHTLCIDIDRNHNKDPLLGESIISAIIHHLIKDKLIFYKYRSNGNISDDQFSNLKNWIEENVTKTITLTSMSTQFDTSVRSLSRTFKSKTGLSPYNYVLLRRIERAKQMMLDGRFSLAVIAEAVGFANHAHMADTFRKLAGAPPSHFYNKRTILPDSRDSTGQIKEIGQNQE